MEFFDNFFNVVKEDWKEWWVCEFRNENGEDDGYSLKTRNLRGFTNDRK